MFFQAAASAAETFMHTDAIPDQFGAAIAINTFIEIWKRSPIPGLTRITDRYNRLVSMALAFATSLGITMGVNGSLEQGHVITIAIPPVAAVITAILHMSVQGGAQEGMYKLMKFANAGIAFYKSQQEAGARELSGLKDRHDQLIGEQATLLTDHAELVAEHARLKAAPAVAPSPLPLSPKE